MSESLSSWISTSAGLFKEKCQQALLKGGELAGLVGGGYLEFFFCIPLFCCWGSTPIFAKANYLCRLSIFNSPGTWATTIQLWGMTECRIFISSHNCMATSPNNGMAAKAWNMQLYMGAVFWTENRLLHKEVKPVPAALPAQCSVLWATSLPWYLDRT